MLPVRLYNNGLNTWAIENWHNNTCKQSYNENIEVGKKICEQSKVAVLSLARNCEKNLQKSIDTITSLVCKEFKFFIYENDSTDQTKNILLLNESNNLNISLNDHHVTTSGARSRERTNNLAKYRNICLDWARKNCSDFDYTIVLDLDADAGFSLKGIYNSISWLEKIKNSAGMASYSLYFDGARNVFHHYDIFAMRLSDWSSSSEIKADEMEQRFSTYYPIIGSDPVSFYSCFGGLCVYKTSCYLKGSYDGSIGCEHVMLHKSIKDKGYDMYLNPSSIFFSVCNL